MLLRIGEKKKILTNHPIMRPTKHVHRMRRANKVKKKEFQTLNMLTPRRKQQSSMPSRISVKSM
eukprot:2440467-Karenia_brevis.AAC.1